jgi:hypothetical protein
MVKVGENVLKELKASTVHDFAVSGGDLSLYTEHEFFSILSFPLATVNPPQLSDFELQFHNTNLFGQVSMLFSRVDQELLRVSLLAKQLKQDEGFLLKKEKELTGILKDYQEARELCNTRHTSWSAVCDDVGRLQSEINVYEKNPVLKAYMERDSSVRQAKDIRSPFQSPSPFATTTLRRNTPSEPPTIGTSINNRSVIWGRMY